MRLMFSFWRQKDVGAAVVRQAWCFVEWWTVNTGKDKSSRCFGQSFTAASCGSACAPSGPEAGRQVNTWHENGGMHVCTVLATICMTSKSSVRYHSFLKEEERDQEYTTGLLIITRENSHI